jgi:hypothetical protein
MSLSFLEPNSVCNDLLEDNGVGIQCTSFNHHLLQHGLHFVRFPGFLLVLNFPALSVRITATYLECSTQPLGRAPLRNWQHPGRALLRQEASTPRLRTRRTFPIKPERL